MSQLLQAVLDIGDHGVSVLGRFTFVLRRFVLVWLGMLGASHERNIDGRTTALGRRKWHDSSRRMVEKDVAERDPRSAFGSGHGTGDHEARIAGNGPIAGD